jgi:hypothetical protein
MTAAVADGLLVLALLDGSFAGFRSSAGRTGLINHCESDYQVARGGAGLLCVLLAPVIAAACADAVARHGNLGDYTRAGQAMLSIYGPYGLVVLMALASYATLTWRFKYLASALILGPLTLLRPVIAVLGGVSGIAASDSTAVAIAASLSVIAVLAVELLASRIWYTKTTQGHPADPPPAPRAQHDNEGSLGASIWPAARASIRAPN